jgi:MarR family 2-MHQ and catechol resistance regulon transcriptional repressor
MNARIAAPVPVRSYVTSGNVTFVADQLEKAGYLRRMRSAEDRRVVFAQLTPKGSARMARVFPEHATAVAGAAGVLTPREQVAPGKILTKWGKAIQRQP